jgi:superfamily II DNA or RNA helicase
MDWQREFGVNMTLYSKLRDFQKYVVDTNLHLIQQVISGEKKITGRQVTVAPTGSGKTFMMASVIEVGLKFKQEPNFIWLTHNKQILIQTQNEIIVSLKNYVVTVYDIEQGIESFNGRVLLFNVQKGVSKNALKWLRKWSNVQKTFDRPLVFIVDEADEAMSGKNMDALRSALNPNLELGFTASFKKKINEYEYITVSYKEVIDAGMLVDQIFYQASNEVARLEMINRAIEQRNYLETIANNLKLIDPERFFIPKMLIQAPAKDCEDMARELQSIINLTESEFREQVVVHTQNSRGLDELEDITNVRYIIGDLMVERGWNCPEAYVLLSTKESVSKSKGIQLLGRIIRLPQAKRFDEAFEKLNKGYVYIAGKHAIEDSCKNFIHKIPEFPPPKEIIQVEKRQDIKVPNIITFKDELVKDIEDIDLIQTSENICAALDELRKKCLQIAPEIRKGNLDLVETSLTRDPNESVEIDWNVEIAKKILIDAITTHIPRNYANLVITKYQISLSSQGGLNSVAPFVKEMAKLVKESRLIRDIAKELQYVYRPYEWPPHKLVLAHPIPLLFKHSLYPKMSLNSEESTFAVYLDDLCSKYGYYWVRNDISDIKLFKGHAPDFIVFNSNKYLFIEFKGKHLLLTPDSRRKNEAGQRAAEYFMIYMEDETGNYICKGRDYEKDEVFNAIMIKTSLGKGNKNHKDAGQ